MIRESCNPYDKERLALKLAKSCRFCGGSLLSVGFRDTGFRSYFVRCQGCGAQGPMSEEMERAVAVWNVEEGQYFVLLQQLPRGEGQDG